MKIKPSKQFLLFFATGGVAAAVNISSRIVLSSILEFKFAVFVAYVLGMVTAYILAKKFVFTKSKARTLRSLAAFTAVNIIAVLQTFAVSASARSLLLPIVSTAVIAETVAHCTGVITPVFTSYLGHKHFSFRTALQPRTIDHRPKEHDVE